MEVVHSTSMNWKGNGLSTRGGGLEMKIISQGKDFTPENHVLLLGRQHAFYSPVHRHNFDQFRYSMLGDFDLGYGLVLKPGNLSYHPEGVYYGPQDDGPDERIALVLQCGGASGQGYTSFQVLKSAEKVLLKKGKIESGKYVADDGSVTDSYQALWEQSNGKKLVYPGERYSRPIVMDPSAFEWRPALKTPGVKLDGVPPHQTLVWKKTLGVFSERELRAEMLKIEPGGSLTLGGDEAIHLLYIVRGEGRAGDEDVNVGSLVRLEAGVQGALAVVNEEIEVLHFSLPLLSSVF